MKSKLKQFLLVILGFIAVWGCSQDDFYNEEINTSSKNIKVQRLKYEDLQKRPIVLEKIQALAGKKSNSHARMVEMPQYEFTVDTGNFVYIEGEPNHSYTFQIYRDDFREDLENLVLSYNRETQSYGAYLIKYTVDENDLRNILDYREIADFTSKTDITFLPEFDSGNLIVQSTITYSYDCTYSVSYEAQLVFVPQLLGGYFYVEQVPVYTLVDCTYNIYDGGGSSGSGGSGETGGGGSSGGGFGGGSGGGSGGGGSSGSGGSGGSGGSDGGNTNPNNPQNPDISFDVNPIFTTPIINLNKNEIKFQNFYNSLTEEQQAVVDANEESFFDYFVDNNFSDEAKEFAQWAVGFLNDNSDVSFEDLLNNKTGFDNQSEIDDYQEGGYDTNTYESFNPQQSWSNITPVIPQSDFVGWGTSGIR